MAEYALGDLSSLLGKKGKEGGDLGSLFSRPFEAPPREEAPPKPRKEKSEGEGLRKKKPKHKRKEPESGFEEEGEGVVGDEKEARTIFVGNLPVDTAADDVKKVFKAYGPIESVRIRSVAIEGAKVSDHGNQSLVRKVCVVQKKIRSGVKDSVHAYVVFRSREAAKTAIGGANGMKMKGHHLRVDTASPTLDPSHSVFVGNIPFDTQDEELWQHFAEYIGDDEAVRSVRIVRDKETLIGKGFGFVLLANKSAVGSALQLHEKTFKERPLRVTVCGKRTKGRQGRPKEGSEPSAFEGRRAEGATRRLAGKGRLVEKSGSKKTRKPEGRLGLK